MLSTDPRANERLPAVQPQFFRAPVNSHAMKRIGFFRRKTELNSQGFAAFLAALVFRTFEGAHGRELIEWLRAVRPDVNGNRLNDEAFVFFSFMAVQVVAQKFESDDDVLDRILNEYHGLHLYEYVSKTAGECAPATWKKEVYRQYRQYGPLYEADIQSASTQIARVPYEMVVNALIQNATGRVAFPEITTAVSRVSVRLLEEFSTKLTRLFREFRLVSA